MNQLDRLTPWIDRRPAGQHTAGTLERLGIDRSSGDFVVSGWLADVNPASNAITLHVDEDVVGEVAWLDRPDVVQAFPMLDAARITGFGYRNPIPPVSPDEWHEVRVQIARDGTAVGQIAAPYRRGFESSLPTPPAAFMRRVMNIEDPGFYAVTGLVSAGQFLRAIREFADPAKTWPEMRLLDLGCGCGRVSGFMRAFTSLGHVAGCDIDPETIGWCRDNLDPDDFVTVDPLPPTSYRDAEFDVVVAFSVFSHLSQEVQKRWLAELARVLQPGGLALITVHGEFAARATYPPHDYELLLAEGIADSILDGALDGVAPPRYYRATFQTRDYTEAHWAEHLEVLAYRDRGANHWQDLVVLRRP